MQEVNGIPAASKSDQKVQESSKSGSSCTGMKDIHQFSNSRKNLKPAIVSLTGFSDLSVLICGCYTSLLLKSSDMNENDFSKPLCSILGLDKVYIYMEADGLTRIGQARLLSSLKKYVGTF